MLEAETENQRALLQAKLDTVTFDGAVLTHRSVDGGIKYHGPIDSVFVVRVAPLLGPTGAIDYWTYWINLQLGDLDPDRVHVFRVVERDYDEGAAIDFSDEDGGQISIARLMPGTDPKAFVEAYARWEKLKMAEFDLYRAAQDRSIDVAAKMAAEWTSSSWGDSGP